MSQNTGHFRKRYKNVDKIRKNIHHWRDCLVRPRFLMGEKNNRRMQLTSTS